MFAQAVQLDTLGSDEVPVREGLRLLHGRCG